jgi:hypothetical protein
VSAQPNRKQQRLARELAKRNDVPYQAALAQVRTAGQEPDKTVAAYPHHKMLEGLYEAFAPTGKWPLFQYISQLWDDSQFEARDVYLDLAEQGLVRPAMTRTHQFQLRENTPVGVSLQGLTRLPTASADLDSFVSAVRYIGQRAADYKPASATELGRLSITGEQVCEHLGIKPDDPASTRVGTLISDEAWQLCSSFGSTEVGTWSMEVNLERARRYRDVNTLAEFLAVSDSAAAPLPTEPTPAIAELIGAGSPAPGQPTAFISYSHQDEAFVLALVQRLDEHGVGVWIDRVDLLIGDSLIRRIGDAIQDEDFVIAVISEHSVKSPWCGKELSLAVTQGIQSKQVKVLPVRLDEVALPSFLTDTLWVETGRSECTAVAAELATAIEGHLKRRGLGASATNTDSSPAGAVERHRPVVEHEPIRWDQINERPRAGEEPVPLEPWLEDRIAGHATLVRQRSVRGDTWFFEALGEWDVRNTHELLTKVAPELVDSYRGDPPGYRPGQEEAYYDRQLAWLTETLRGLETPSAPASGAAVEVVTPESIADELNSFVRTAGQLLQGDVTHDQVDDWAGKAGITVRARGPDGEEDVFLSVGRGLDPRARLEAKLARIQNHILPKVNAGEWTR